MAHLANPEGLNEYLQRMGMCRIRSVKFLQQKLLLYSCKLSKVLCIIFGVVTSFDVSDL
jgi:hypothetical protein